MHRGGAYLAQLLSPTVGANPPASAKKMAATTLVLTQPQVSTLLSALADDAQDYYYSACISVVDALRGLHCGFYTWATVKLYYSVYYSLRSWLASDKVCVFYVQKTPFSIIARPGERGVKGSGTSHAFVLRRFSAINTAHAYVTQQIDSMSALDWLVARREESNYRIPRFSEPEAPEHFRQVETYGLRRSVSTYIQDVADSTHLYTFGKDHAMLALPIDALMRVGGIVKGMGSVRIDADELELLMRECCDELGPLTPITNVFRAFAS